MKEAHLLDSELAPRDVPAEAQEMVQEVVPAGDGREDFPYHADVLAFRNVGHRTVHFLDVRCHFLLISCDGDEGLCAGHIRPGRPDDSGQKGP